MTWRLLARALVAAGLLLACDGETPSGDGGAAVRDGGDAPTVVDVAGVDGRVDDLAPVETGGGSGGTGGADAKDAPPSSGTRQLDLLFVIDNSASMGEEQASLRQAFPTLIETLQAAPGGLPDLHIAIVSTNVGAGPTQPSPECPPLGDRGRFQVRAGCGLDAAGSRFLTVGSQGARNFTGELSQVFSCLATLGTSGCGYEHQLQSLRAALAGRTINVENEGFLRTDAALGIVVLSDEDDCSGDPEADFYGEFLPGQAGSLKCALLGHICRGQAVPAMVFHVPLSECVPYVRTDSERRSRLINVNEIVDFVAAVKPGRMDRIFVSTIIGWNDDPAATYNIIQRPAGIGGQELDLAPVCSSVAAGVAAPGIRLRTFARAFPNHTVHSICTGDLTPAMREIGQKLAAI